MWTCFLSCLVLVPAGRVGLDEARDWLPGLVRSDRACHVGLGQLDQTDADFVYLNCQFGRIYMSAPI